VGRLVLFDFYQRNHSIDVRTSGVVVLIRKESDQKREIEEIKEWTTHLENMEISIKHRDGGRRREAGKERKNKGPSNMEMEGDGGKQGKWPSGLMTLVTHNFTCICGHQGMHDAM
jgi:hypothetical protein